MQQLFSFEKLLVWQKSIKLVTSIYDLTKKFPTDEQFGITSQIRRSSLSISNNIAEGSGKITAKDKARYTTIAYGSTAETLNIIIVCKEIGLINQHVYQKLRVELDEIASMLSGLRKAQLKKQ